VTLDLNRPYRTRDGRAACAVPGPDGRLYGWAASPGGTENGYDAECWSADGIYDPFARIQGESPWDLFNVAGERTDADERRLDDLLMSQRPDARSFVPEALEKIASIYRDRNGTYGDNYLHAGEVLLGLFPHGLELKTADQFNRFHLVVHLASKLSRYCMTMELRGEGHADSLDDLSVYAQMLREFDALAANKP